MFRENVMSWIKTVPEDEAQGTVAEMYEEARSKFGYVTNLFKLLSLQPSVMQNSIKMYRHVTQVPSGINTKQRLLIGTVVSRMNGCQYCIEVHEHALREELSDDEQLRAVQEDYTSIEFDRPTRVLLDFASKLTRNPQEMTKADVDLLRECGFADKDILHAAQLISQYNYTNRVLVAMGIGPEPGMRYGEE